MSIFFKMNSDGRVKIYPYAISNGTRTVLCETEKQANAYLGNRRYTDYAIIESDEPSEKLLETLKGVRFDTIEDAENFINGGGYEESIPSRLADIELVVAEMIGGAE